MTDNIPSPYKGKTGKNTVIEDVEYGVDELPDLYFSKCTAIVFDKIYIRKAGVLPLSKFVELIETLSGGGVIVSIWWFMCVNYNQMKVVVCTVLNF